MKKLQSLSIFFPVYNDAHTIEKLVKNAYSIGKQCTDNLEVIIVNDGSTDTSAVVITKIKKRYPNLRVITHGKNKGYGAALITGFRAAKKTWVFYTDSDGQYDVKELPKLVSKVTADISVVNGFKIQRHDSVMRQIVGALYNLLLHFLYKIPIKDTDCDFRLIKRKYINQIKLQSASGGICLELILALQSLDVKFVQVGVHHYPRIYGQSQFLTVGNLFHTLKDHIALFKRYY